MRVSCVVECAYVFMCVVVCSCVYVCIFPGQLVASINQVGFLSPHGHLWRVDVCTYVSCVFVVC